MTPVRSMAQIRTEPTPNPNSLKFSTRDGTFLDGGVAAFATAQEAADDPLAHALFELDGVDDVFVTPQFVTVSKSDDAEWGALSPQIENVLATFLAA